MSEFEAIAAQLDDQLREEADITAAEQVGPNNLEYGRLSESLYELYSFNVSDNLAFACQM